MTAWLDAMVAIWLIEAVLGTVAVGHYARAVRRVAAPVHTAPAAVIVPVRGTGNLERLLPTLRAQRFPRWRLIFAVETADDPAHAVLARFAAATGARPETELVVAGIATDSSQKLHNQLAALTRLRSGDEVVVFADADIVPAPDWLARLVHPLGSHDVQAVSGWRWLVPDGGGLATAFVCAAHGSFSLAPRLRRWNLAWGGSMALRRAYLDEIDLPAWWRGAALDDLRLTRAVRERGGTILGPSALLVPTPVRYGWRDGAAFIRRQYLFIRIHAPRHWAIAAAAVTTPPLGWAAATAAAAAGQNWPLFAFVPAVAMHQWRAAQRRDVARRLWNEPADRRQEWLARAAVPAWQLFHVALLWSTAFGRTIRWAGRIYRLDAAGKLRTPPEIAPRNNKSWREGGGTG